jgi:hypothetical protein
MPGLFSSGEAPRAKQAALQILGTATDSWAMPTPESINQPRGETRMQRPGDGIFKCVANGKISYTDEPCPQGTKQASIRGGTVNVLRSARQADITTPALPDTQGQSTEPGLMESRIEAIINR